MGKKKKAAVCNNPVAMARAAGPPPISGPTIRDYLDRDRPSLEEAAGIIASQYSKPGSGALAAYEEQLNEKYKLELKKRREKLLGASSSHTSRSKSKKKSKKRKKRDRTRSRSPHSTPSPRHSDTRLETTRQDHARSHKSHKRKHRHKHHSTRHSSSSSDLES